MDAKQAQQVLKEADCLYSDAEVKAAIEKMADQIKQKLSDRNPLALCVMTGAVIPAGHLLTHLDFPLQIDYIHATRYRGQTSGGKLHWIARPSHELKGRDILIVDDIFDEGVTLSEIIDYCYAEGANEVFTAVLIDKKHDRKAKVNIDFVGLETEDRYLFGYGMDYHGYLRNAAGIYAVKGM